MIGVATTAGSPDLDIPHAVERVDIVRWQSNSYQQSSTKVPTLHTSVKRKFTSTFMR
jgi:hypothetical protein